MDMQKALEITAKLAHLFDDDEESANAVYVFSQAVLAGKEQDALAYVAACTEVAQHYEQLSLERETELVVFCDAFESLYLCQ